MYIFMCIPIYTNISYVYTYVYMVCVAGCIGVTRVREHIPATLGLRIASAARLPPQLGKSGQSYSHDIEVFREHRGHLFWKSLQ